jgi:hypothetical protein
MQQTTGMGDERSRCAYDGTVWPPDKGFFLSYSSCLYLRDMTAPAFTTLLLPAFTVSLVLSSETCEEDKHAVNVVSFWFLIVIGRSNCHIASGIEMYLLRGVKTLTLVKNVRRDILTKICCVAGLCSVVMMSFFLGNDALVLTLFISLSIHNPWAGYSVPEADAYIAVIVLTDVKPYKYKSTANTVIVGLQTFISFLSMIKI